MSTFLFTFCEFNAIVTINWKVIFLKTRIAELRKENGLTLKQLGEILNVKDNALSQYETGKRTPQLALLKEISNYFHVSLEYLTYSSDQRDYSIDSTEDDLNLLNMLNNGDIKFSNLSYTTSLDLSLWVMENMDFITKEHSKLVPVSKQLVEATQTDRTVLKAYRVMRNIENTALNKIEAELSFFDDERSDFKPETGATTVLKFIQEAKRIGFDKTQEILKEMENMPDNTL